MGRSRLKLQSLLEELGGEQTPLQTYFQPPANTQMKYPCVLYEQDAGDTKFADNSPYRYTKRYQLTYISDDPDDGMPDKIAHLPGCTFDRRFVSENLIHVVFSIYF